GRLRGACVRPPARQPAGPGELALLPARPGARTIGIRCLIDGTLGGRPAALCAARIPDPDGDASPAKRPRDERHHMIFTDYSPPARAEVVVGGVAQPMTGEALDRMAINAMLLSLGDPDKAQELAEHAGSS